MSAYRIIVGMLLCWLLHECGLSQTVFLAQPVADHQGMVAFKITQILRLEGNWEKPFLIDQLLYPLKPAKAHPLGRFGESILVIFRRPGDLRQWYGYNIHDGCIPALSGCEAKEVIDKIVSAPPPPPTTGKGSSRPAASRQVEYGICPICKQRHIIIRY